MFSNLKLIYRSLSHFWRMNLAVMLAAAVGVAVLTGSLLLGSSMRGSLRDLTLERLGGVAYALTGEHFFREALAHDIARNTAKAELGREVISFAHPAIILDGSAVEAESGARASHVQVLGVGADFWVLDDVKPAKPGNWPAPGQEGAIINAALAREIGARAGDELLVRVQRPSAIPRETTLGERDDTVVTLRLPVTKVIPMLGRGRFGLRPSQGDPFNIYIPLPLLQERLKQAGRVNSILISDETINPQAALNRSFNLDDVGLRLKPNEKHGYLALESSRLFLPEGVEAAARQVAAEMGLKAEGTLVYLANGLSLRGQSIPYSMVAALGEETLGEGEIALNTWAADNLKARVGDRIGLTYYVQGTRGKLDERTTTLTLARIVPLNEATADPGLTPDFPGIAEADDMQKWDAPFPLDMKRIRPADEDYWQTYRTTPKAFVGLAAGQRLWGSRFGNLTSLRILGANNKSTMAAFAERLRRRLDPARLGLTVQPVKAQGLTASKGSSDFGGLFIGFSLFLLVSAAMLIQILFALGAEGRAREWGLLGAVGFTPRRVLGLMLAEGSIVAGLGGALGLALGVVYARLLIHGLHTWWLGAVGTPFMELHVTPADLAGGFVGGWAVAVLAIWRAARRFTRLSVRSLLAGRAAEEGTLTRRRPWKALLLAGVMLLSGIGLALGAARQPAETQAEMFFGAGALLLIGALALFRAWLARGAAGGTAERLTLTRLGFSATCRRPGRSLLVAALMASATFVIVAVGANRQRPSGELGKESGGDGFALVAESALPLYGEIDTSILMGAKVYPFRLRAGDDASCLNLYQALNPRLLGTPEPFIRRGGFAFAASLAGDGATQANPWLLLDRPQPDGATPVIGDFNTVVWLLHAGLGKELTIGGVRCRIVGLLKGSLFQSELLMSEVNFTRLYPGEGGWRYFLFETLPQPRPASASAATLATALESHYESYGLDATGVPERLAALLSVENTYLSTFQSLGGLGLLLGTLGLALALFRNLLERRAEFALLRAVGYRFGALLWLAVSENLLLLAVGMLAGVLCALVALYPGLAARSLQPAWLGLGVTLAGVFLFGLLATTLSAAAVLRAPALRSLREE